jgi:hypothetical protein
MELWEFIQIDIKNHYIDFPQFLSLIFLASKEKETLHSEHYFSLKKILDSSLNKYILQEKNSDPQNLRDDL